MLTLVLARKRLSGGDVGRVETIDGSALTLASWRSRLQAAFKRWRDSAFKRQMPHCVYVRGDTKDGGWRQLALG